MKLVRVVVSVSDCLSGDDIQDFEDAADNGHRFIRLAADAVALARKECPVPLAPIVKRTVAFTLDGGVLGIDRSKGDDRNPCNWVTNAGSLR